MLKQLSVPIVLFLFIMSACAALGPLNPTPTPSGGIQGTAREGPMCPGPVPVGNNPCPDQPYQATIVILNSNNQEITQVQTDANGYFIIPLDPGTYTLHPVSGNPFPIAADQTVEVITGQYTQISIQFDTGMR